MPRNLPPTLVLLRSAILDPRELLRGTNITPAQLRQLGIDPESVITENVITNSPQPLPLPTKEAPCQNERPEDY